VVGLTGPNASGKGEAAKLLVAAGCTAWSLSDIVREAAAAAGLAPSRDNLIATGVRLREEGGPGILAERILSRLTGPSVVDSIRGPAEVAVLRRAPGFVLLGIDAPIALRFERSRQRARLGDGATLEEFAAKEARENAATESGQQILKTMALADRTVVNDGTLADLAGRLHEALASLGCRLPSDLLPSTGSAAPADA
jgi:dephospho-CoA kinase